jgi:hypothetical protein
LKNKIFTKKKSEIINSNDKNNWMILLKGSIVDVANKTYTEELINKV